MTTVAAIEYKGGVWLASDSFFGTDDSVDISSGPKFVSHGPFWVAYAGSHAILNIAKMCRIFAIKKNEREVDYIYRTICIPCMKKIVSLSLGKIDFSMIVVFDGKIYEIDQDFAIARSGRGYSVIGSGMDLAASSIYTMKRLVKMGIVEMKERSILETAMRITETLSTKTRSPFYFQNIQKGRQNKTEIIGDETL